jgi:hypothetical protein
MKKLPQGEELLREAAELGVSLRPLPDEKDLARFDFGPSGDIVEPALQARVLAARREKRDARLWQIALISAVASVVSAVAAWFSALHH